MKKTIKLTENDLVRLVNKVLNEQQRATGWKEEGEGGTIPVMTMQQFFNDNNWGGRGNREGGDSWIVQTGFDSASIIFGKGGKKIRVKV